MRVLITGAGGMLAQAIKDAFQPGNDLILTGSKELDITDSSAVQDFIAHKKPGLIINCAAYTDVDKAESEPALAHAVNATGSKNLAVAAQANNAVLVHFSTDYVFDGARPLNETYSEDDPKNPLSVYGKTKSEGEDNIKQTCEKYYIFRTAWLYGDGKNFVRTMLNLSKTHSELAVVDDQYGSPTSTDDLARVVDQVIKNKLPYGTYHATNQGFTTRYDFAKKIFELSYINCEVKPVSSAEFPRAATRPKNSKLNKEKLLQSNIILPAWEDALTRYLKKEIQGV